MASNKKTVQDKNLLEFTMSEFTKQTFDCVHVYTFLKNILNIHYSIILNF